MNLNHRRIWFVSFPLILSGISETIVEVIDVLFLGHYGLTELGAIAIADAIWGVATVMTIGLSDGIQVVIARRAGQKRDQAIGEAFNQGLYLMGIVSILIILFVLYASPLLTRLCVSTPEIAAATDDFLRVIAFAAPFHALNLALGVLYVGLSKTRILITATGILAITNIALDYCLIFGNLGFPEMGISGAAWGSLAAEIAAALYLTAQTVRSPALRTLGLFRLRRWHGQLSRLLAALSWPVALEAFVEALRWLVFFLIVARLGEAALAGSEIIHMWYVIFLVPLDGFSEATCSMVSHLIGEQKSGRISILLRKAMSLSYGFVLPLAALAIIFPEWFVLVFSTEPEMLAISSAGVRVIAVALLIAVPGEMYASAITGTGDTTATFVIEVIRTALILLFAYVAALRLELALEYIWMSVILGWVVCFALSWFWFGTRKWQRLQI